MAGSWLFVSTSANAMKLVGTTTRNTNRNRIAWFARAGLDKENHMYIGERGCQCPKCGTHHPEYRMNDELDEWYECINADCCFTGDKYDFTCTSLPEGYVMTELEKRLSLRAAS